MFSKLKLAQSVIGIGSFLLLSSCSPQATQPPTEPPKVSEWTVSDAAAPKLTETFDSSRFTPALAFKMPKGFPVDVKEAANRKFDIFYGPRRKDKTRAVFMLNVVSTKLGATSGSKSYTLPESMELVLKAQKEGRTQHWTSSPLESGSIGGQTWMRCYWSGDEPGTKESMHGFLYGTLQGEDFVEFAAQDMAKYDKEALPLLEEAVHTVKFAK